MYCKSGLIYFINNTTINHNYYMNLTEDIRRLIWKYAHIYPYIHCCICNKILINFNYHTLCLEIDLNSSENLLNYTIINDMTKCNDCLD